MKHIFFSFLFSLSGLFLFAQTINPNADPNALEELQRALALSTPTATDWESLAGTAPNNGIADIVVHGTDVYVGGGFTDLGGNANADGIAHWDGTAWHNMGLGLDGWVYDIEMMGTDVIAAGNFFINNSPTSTYLARWDGTSWQPIAPNLNGLISAISIKGTSIYATGHFTDAGGDPNSDYFAVWQNGAWVGYGLSSFNAPAFDVELIGNDIYVCGSFTDVDGNPAIDYVAHWNGSWNGLGSTSFNAPMYALDKDGTDLLIAGTCTAPVQKIGRWGGSSWWSLGGGVSADAIEIYAHDGVVYVGGNFQNAGGVSTADYIAKWDGTGWEALGTGLNATVRAIAVQGCDVWAGGDFTDAGGDVNADNIARVGGQEWTAATAPLNEDVHCMAWLNGDLYVGGEFTDLGGNPDADYFARWDGSQWHEVGGGLSGSSGVVVNDLEVFGGLVYVAGKFDQAGSYTVPCIAAWNPSIGDWQGGGAPPPPAVGGANAVINAVAILPQQIIIGGDNLLDQFGTPSTIMSLNVWQNIWYSWHSEAPFEVCNDLFIDYAAAPVGIYAAGTFTSFNANFPPAMVKWDNATNSWIQLGNNAIGTGFCIELHNGNVFVGGEFGFASNSTTYDDDLAYWDGTTWNNLGPFGDPGAQVHALESCGSDLYIGGLFSNVSGSIFNQNLVVWDGTTFSYNDAIPEATVLDIMEVNNELYIGGKFTNMINVFNSDTYQYLAKFGRCPIPLALYADTDNDGFGDAASPILGFPGPGLVADNTDCDDTDPTIYPGAPEFCGDGKDNDCDGIIDNPSLLPSIADIVRDDRVRLKWGNIPGNCGYEVRFRFPNPSAVWRVRNSPNRIKWINSLIANTMYEYQIRYCCNGTWSAWTASQFFTTSCCSVPQNVFTDNIATNRIRANWDPVCNANSYEILYRVQGPGVWSRATRGPNTSTAFISKNLTGLSSTTNYEYKVRTRCPWGRSGFTAVQNASTTFTSNPTDRGAEETVQDFALYPNPATDELWIEGSGEALYQIWSIEGRLMSSGQLNAAEYLPVSDWPRGQYHIKFIQSDGHTQALPFFLR